MGEWSRWPLLIGALACLAVAVRIFDAVDDDGASTLAALMLTVAGSVLLGAFIYSQGRDK